MTEYRLAENVTMQGIGEETVLLDLGKGLYYRLDAMGTQILGYLLEGQDENSIVSTILAEYEADEAVVLQDMAKLVAELRDQGLLSG